MSFTGLPDGESLVLFFSISIPDFSSSCSSSIFVWSTLGYFNSWMFSSSSDRSVFG